MSPTQMKSIVSFKAKVTIYSIKSDHKEGRRECILQGEGLQNSSRQVFACLAIHKGHITAGGD